MGWWDDVTVIGWPWVNFHLDFALSWDPTQRLGWVTAPPNPTRVTLMGKVPLISLQNSNFGERNAQVVPLEEDLGSEAVG